jgi:TolB protein
LLKQSWREARETLEGFLENKPWFSFVAAATVLALIGVVVSQTRGEHQDPATRLQADQQAFASPTTAPGPQPTFPLLTPTSLGGPTTTGAAPFGGLHPVTTTTPKKASGTTTTAPSGQSSTTTDATTTTTAATGPAIAPSAFKANRIAYVANGGTWTVNPDGTDPQPVAPDAYFPAWSPAHGTIAVANADGALSWVSSAGSRFQLTAGGAQQDSAPSWSPGGGHLAFARRTSDNQSSIVVIDSDGRNAHQVSTGGCINADPAWSPDGNHIAFLSSRDHCSPNTGEFELYVMDTDGTNVVRLGTAANSGAPSFSPDGQTIAFSSDRASASIHEKDIYTIKIDGSDEKRLTTSAGEDTEPTWSPGGSPDGTRIAFRSDRGNGGIFTMKPDGSDLHLVITNAAQPSWS